MLWAIPVALADVHAGRFDNASTASDHGDSPRCCARSDVGFGCRRSCARWSRGIVFADGQREA